ncbi:MAG: RNA ligase family protein, partial [Bradyrhizobium sp.]|nr:RNA ligase family protein [Bradyrhizobium sp.]
MTEKIDGTNAQIAWFELQSEEAVEAAAADPLCLKVVSGQYDGESPMALYAGSRNRWLLPGKQDNFGFAAWVFANSAELLKLGPGRHFGEWYGAGIQRGYGLTEKRFALFNTARWLADDRATCCDVVPILAKGEDINL